MLQPDSLEFRILNETCDDAENLEQIYRALSLEFSADRYDPADPNSYYWREAADAASLAEIANAVKSLVEGGLIVVRHDPAQKPAEGDLAYIWQAWFEVSAEGRKVRSQFAEQAAQLP